MRVARFVSAVVAAALVLGGPAAAGTRAAPEIEDPCTGQITNNNDMTSVQHESVDICSVWLDSVGGGTGLRVTMRTFGDLEERPGGAYMVWWNSGSCTYSVTVDDSTESEMPRAFAASCGEETTWTCPVPDVSIGCEAEGGGPRFSIPAGNVVSNGKELQVTVSFTGALAKYANAHDPGSVLAKPRAYATLVTGPVYAYSTGCTFGFPEDHCFEVNGDMTPSGRSYTIPHP